MGCIEVLLIFLKSLTGSVEGAGVVQFSISCLNCFYPQCLGERNARILRSNRGDEMVVVQHIIRDVRACLSSWSAVKNSTDRLGQNK